MDKELTFSEIRARMSILSKDLESNSVHLQDNTTLNVTSSKLHCKSAEKSSQEIGKEFVDIGDKIISRVSIKTVDKKTETLKIANSHTELIQEKGRPLVKPPVSQKPKVKTIAIGGTGTSVNFDQISLPATSKTESVVIENKPINESTTQSVQKERVTHDQQCSTVNKLRLQFEQQTNIQKPAFEVRQFSGRRQLVPESTSGNTLGITKTYSVGDIKTEPHPDNSYGISDKKNAGVSLLPQNIVGDEEQMPTMEIQTNFYSFTDEVTNEDVIYENINLTYQPYQANQGSRHIPTPAFGYNKSRTAKTMSEAFILKEQHQGYNQQASANQKLGALFTSPPTQVFVDEDLDDELDDEFDEQLPSQDPIYSNYVYAINSSSALQDLPRFSSENPRQRSSYAEAFTPALIRPQLKSSVSFNQGAQVRNQFDQNKTKCNQQLSHIMEELIKTEEDYVQTLLNGITNYATNMFARKDLPRNLQGKEFHLFGPIEGIATFHSDILLPMFRRNRNNPGRLFEEFLLLIKNRYMYNYVMYTMNRRRSQEIVENFAPYFAYIQEELGEKLGIESFLLQPVQRLPRYALLLKEFVKTLFTANISKEHLKSCCALEIGLRNLLSTADEADKIVDIVNWAELNICNPNNEFRKVLDLYIFDLDRHIGYAGKVFVFEKCMIYTEIISDKNLLYRGFYDALKKIDLIPTKNSFRMSQKGCQVLEFRPNSSDNIQYSIKFIETMIDCNSKDEVVSNCIDCKIRQTYRNSDRPDSGLGWDKDLAI